MYKRQEHGKGLSGQDRLSPALLRVSSSGSNLAVRASTPMKRVPSMGDVYKRQEVGSEEPLQVAFTLDGAAHGGIFLIGPGDEFKTGTCLLYTSIVQSLDDNFNVRRAERFMIQMQEENINPVLVFNNCLLYTSTHSIKTKIFFIILVFFVINLYISIILISVTKVSLIILP